MTRSFTPNTVDEPVRGVDFLDAEAPRRIEAVEVRLLHRDLTRQRVDVVLVRRIARPVAGWDHPFADVEVLGVEFLVEHDGRGAGRCRNGHAPLLPLPAEEYTYGFS